MENANDDFCVKDLTVTLVSSWKSCPYMFQISRVEHLFPFPFFPSNYSGFKKIKNKKKKIHKNLFFELSC